MVARQRQAPARALLSQDECELAVADAITVKEIGIDWITATARETVSRDKLKSIGEALLLAQSWTTSKCEPWSFMGCEGLKAEGCAYAESDAFSIIRLSGPCSHSHWSNVYQACDNVSRLDLQVTLKGVPNATRQIMAHHRESMRHFAGAVNPPTIELRANNRRGPTLYFNTRASSRFGRVYDKYRESKLSFYENCLRYETQLNGKTALLAARRLMNVETRDATISAHVHAFFTAKGCTPRWRPAQTSLLSSPRARTTADRRLRWLATQVRGCLEKLSDVGLRSEALRALGLDEATLDTIDKDGEKRSDMK